MLHLLQDSSQPGPIWRPIMQQNRMSQVLGIFGGFVSQKKALRLVGASAR